VSVRYILAAIAFAVAALGFILLPAGGARGAAPSEPAEGERDVMIRAVCFDAAGNPHPAAQTFAEREVGEDYEGELFRCGDGARMRYTVGENSYECALGDALVIDRGELACGQQAAGQGAPSHVW
jgi:hypothetical protein